MRSAKRLASVALSANCHAARPKRRVSSPATHAASAVGSIAVAPRPICSATAALTAGSAWPPIAPVSPRQRSTYSWPSTSSNRPPSAAATYNGNGPGQRRIHAIGTDPSRCSAASSASAAERGWPAT